MTMPVPRNQLDVLRMRRREFIAGLAATATWSVAARAQQPNMPVVGFLGAESPRRMARQLRAFQQGLNEAGYAEGRNVAIEYRWAGGQWDLLPVLAADLISHHVTALATSTDRAALAAKAASTVVPIVFLSAGDPVRSGIVSSLARPGGNLTGITSLNGDLAPKRLELLHDLIPQATSLALLVNPANPNAEARIKNSQEVARRLGLEFNVLRASTENELDAVFTKVGRPLAGGVVVDTDTFFNVRHERIAELALRYAVPTVFQYREFAAAGGLVSYGGSNTDGWRLVGIYTGRILKGDKPADLPVQQATRIELFVNLKTAKALGITIPEPIMVRADEVFE
jgi:putative tryptophan/tyrosine transport system substrate-binding protein